MNTKAAIPIDFSGLGFEIANVDTEHYSCNKNSAFASSVVVAVNDFDDREQLNRILLYRYIIYYEPFNFKGQLADFPLTLAYG